MSSKVYYMVLLGDYGISELVFNFVEYTVSSTFDSKSMAQWHRSAQNMDAKD